MDQHFVTVTADIDCAWEGPNPTYRVFVNNEMFTERTWIWTQEYLQEILNIHAPPGDYVLRWELVPPHLGRFRVRNVQVNNGPGHFVEDQILRITG
jgi:hypothetical protein